MRYIPVAWFVVDGARWLWNLSFAFLCAHIIMRNNIICIIIRTNLHHNIHTSLSFGSLLLVLTAVYTVLLTSSGWALRRVPTMAACASPSSLEKARNTRRRLDRCWDLDLAWNKYPTFLREVRQYDSGPGYSLALYLVTFFCFFFEVPKLALYN